MRGARRAVLKHTIWAPDAVPAIEGVTSREMKQFVLPLFDVAVVIMGVNAIGNGMPSFSLALPGWLDPWLSVVAAWVLALGGAVAFIGLAIPRLWVAEAIGKLMMVAVLGGYASALWALFLAGEPGRAFVAAGMSALVALPLWNLRRLGRERLARSEARPPDSGDAR